MKFELSSFCLESFFCVLLIVLLLTSSADGQQTKTTPKPKPAQAPTQAVDNDQDSWKLYTPSDARASFMMPIKPRYVERVFAPVKDKPPIKVYLRQGIVNQGKTTYLFVYNDLNEFPRDVRTRNNALDGCVRGSVINVSGQLIGKVTPIRYKAHMGRQFSYSYRQGDKPFVVTSRVFLVGRRIYQATFLALESEYKDELAAKFLNSFRLVAPPNDDPPEPRL